MIDADRKIRIKVTNLVRLINASRHVTFGEEQVRGVSVFLLLFQFAYILWSHKISLVCTFDFMLTNSLWSMLVNRISWRRWLLLQWVASRFSDRINKGAGKWRMPIIFSIFLIIDRSYGFFVSSVIQAIKTEKMSRHREWDLRCESTSKYTSNSSRILLNLWQLNYRQGVCRQLGIEVSKAKAIRLIISVGNRFSFDSTARGDLEASFGKYGTLKNVWVARNPPGFAFVEFEDPRDAEDAVRALDGS